MLLSLELSKYKERERERRSLLQVESGHLQGSTNKKRRYLYDTAIQHTHVHIYVYIHYIVVSITVVTLSPPTTINYVELVSDILLL